MTRGIVALECDCFCHMLQIPNPFPMVLDLSDASWGCEVVDTFCDFLELNPIFVQHVQGLNLSDIIASSDTVARYVLKQQQQKLARHTNLRNLFKIGED